MNVRDKARSLWTRRSRVDLDDLLPIAAVGLGGSLLVVTLVTIRDAHFNPFTVTLMVIACVCVMVASRWVVPAAVGLAVVVLLVWFTPEKVLQTASLSVFFMVLLLLWRRHVREALIFGAWYLGTLITQMVPYSSSTEELINGTFIFGALMLSFATVGELLGRQSDANMKLDERRREELSEQRSAIARELHDTAVYSTTMVVMRAEAMKLKLQEVKGTQQTLKDADGTCGDRNSTDELRLWQMVEEYQAHLSDDLEFIARTGRRATADLRAMLSLLRASDRVADVESLTSAERFTIPTLPLQEILLEEANKLRAAGVEVQTAVEGDLNSISGETNSAFAKIVTEVCSNMVKHASRETAATVMIDVQDDFLEAAFVNGTPVFGSPMKDLVRHEGLGLVGMRERAESLGGTVEVSATESRWIVRVSLPARR